MTLYITTNVFIYKLKTNICKAYFHFNNNFFNKTPIKKNKTKFYINSQIINKNNYKIERKIMKCKKFLEKSFF